MAVSFRSRTRGASAGAASITVDKPAGLADGDFVVVQFTINGTDVTDTPATGFSLLDADATSGADGEIWTKAIVSASGEGTWTFTLTGSETWEYVCSAWIGCAGVSTAVSTELHEAFSSSTTTIPSVTVPDDGSVVIAGIMLDSSSRTTTAPAGYTEISDTAQDWGTGQQGCAGYYIAADSGATGTIAIGISSAVNYWAYAFALEPGATGSFDQEGFRFYDDDGDEDGSTALDAQDTNVSVPLGDLVHYRALIDITDDPPSTAFTLYAQKNGAGGYSAVPVGTTRDVPPLVETGDVSSSGNNTAQASWAVSTPAASTGDLIIMCLGWDDSTNTTDATPANGPNSETWTRVGGAVVASSGTEVRATVWRTIATGSWSSGTITTTPAATESWIARVIRVPAGEFDGTTPIGTSGTVASAGTAESSITSPALSAGSSDGGGTLINWSVADADPQTVSGTGWTSLSAQDIGDVSCALAKRDAATTDSESISAVTVATITSDSWCSVGFIIRGVTAANELYVATSSNIGGSDATTARLAAPSGKSTSDFVAGVISDNANPLAGVDVTANDYTEVGHVLATASPAAPGDYWDLRYYNGSSALGTYSVTGRLTVADADTDASAGSASGTGTSQAPTRSVAPVVGSSSGTGSAHNATVSTEAATSASASVASGTGTGQAPAAITVAPVVGSASGTGTGQTAAGAVSVRPAGATGSGTAYNAAPTNLPVVTSTRHGAVTTTTARVNVELTGSSDPELLVSTSSDLSSPVTTVSGVQSGATTWWDFAITGLSAGTTYYAGFDDSPIAQFTTATGSAESYIVWAGSCWNGGSTNVFDRMIAHRASAGLPSMFLALGDWPYIDNEDNAETNYLEGWSDAYSTADIASLLASTELYYTWSDHDYGGNNSDGTAAYREEAQAAFRRVHPTPTLPGTDGQIYHSWSRGRVRWVMLDVFSDREPEASAPGDFLGAEQLAWLVNIIQTATEAVVVINTSEAWIIDGEDNGWDLAPDERETIANAIQAAGAYRFIIIHGDAHMLAWDDGTNSNYATTPSGDGPHVFCFAPLDNTNSEKGGPYSGGVFDADQQQYGEIEVEEDAGSLTLWVRGYSVSSPTAETERFEVELTFTPVSAGHASGTGTSHTPSRSVAPVVGVASGTGAASGATGEVDASGGAATGTGTSQTPQANVAPVVGSSSASGTAYNATISTEGAANAAAGVAEGTGTSQTPQANVAPAVEAAAGTGAAHDASASTTGATNAAAGVAGGTGAGQDPTATVAPVVGAATGTGSGHDATASTTGAGSASAQAATGTGTASDATGAVAPGAGSSAGSGTAATPSVALAASGGAATGTGAGQGTAVTITTAASPATGTGAASGPGGSALVNTSTSSGTGSAHDATISTATLTQAQAQVATGTGTASGPDAIRVTTASGAGTGTGTGHDATVSFPRDVPAPAATGSGSGHSPTVTVSSEPATGTGAGTAHDADPETGGSVQAEPATATGTAHDAVTSALSDFSQPRTGGWNTWLGILRDAEREMREDTLTAERDCPNDGHPLRQGPGGVWYCPFDGWRSRNR